MVSKAALWEERDKAIKQGINKLNNVNIDKFASDSQARIGCKGKKNYWFGYKRHVAACMRHGLITKVAITTANVKDRKRVVKGKSMSVRVDLGVRRNIKKKIRKKQK